MFYGNQTNSQQINSKLNGENQSALRQHHRSSQQKTLFGVNTSIINQSQPYSGPVDFSKPGVLRCNKTGHNKAHSSLSGTQKSSEQTRRKSTGGFGLQKGRENAATPTPMMKQQKHTESLRNLGGYVNDKFLALETPIRQKDQNPVLGSDKSALRMAQHRQRAGTPNLNYSNSQQQLAGNLTPAPENRGPSFKQQQESTSRLAKSKKQREKAASKENTLMTYHEMKRSTCTSALSSTQYSDKNLTSVNISTLTANTNICAVVNANQTPTREPQAKHVMLKQSRSTKSFGAYDSGNLGGLSSHQTSQTTLIDQQHHINHQMVDPDAPYETGKKNMGGYRTNKMNPPLNQQHNKVDTIQVFEQTRKKINKANCPVHAAKHRRHLTTNQQVQDQFNFTDRQNYLQENQIETPKQSNGFGYQSNGNSTLQGTAQAVVIPHLGRTFLNNEHSLTFQNSHRSQNNVTNSLETGRPALQDNREQDLQETQTAPRTQKNMTVITDIQKAFLGNTQTTGSAQDYFAKQESNPTSGQRYETPSYGNGINTGKSSSQQNGINFNQGSASSTGLGLTSKAMGMNSGICFNIDTLMQTVHAQKFASNTNSIIEASLSHHQSSNEKEPQTYTNAHNEKNSADHQACLLYNLLKQKQNEQQSGRNSARQVKPISKETTIESQFGESFGKALSGENGDLQLANQFREVVRGIINDRYKEENTALAEDERLLNSIGMHSESLKLPVDASSLDEIDLMKFIQAANTGNYEQFERTQQINCEQEISINQDINKVQTPAASRPKESLDFEEKGGNKLMSPIKHLFSNSTVDPKEDLIVSGPNTERSNYDLQAVEEYTQNNKPQIGAHLKTAATSDRMNMFDKPYNNTISISEAQPSIEEILEQEQESESELQDEQNMVILRVISKGMTESVEEKRRIATVHIKRKSDPPSSAVKYLQNTDHKQKNNESTSRMVQPFTRQYDESQKNDVNTTLQTYQAFSQGGTPEPEPEVYAPPPMQLENSDLQSVQIYASELANDGEFFPSSPIYENDFIFGKSLQRTKSVHSSEFQLNQYLDARHEDIQESEIIKPMRVQIAEEFTRTSRPKTAAAAILSGARALQCRKTNKSMDKNNYYMKSKASAETIQTHKALRSTKKIKTAKTEQKSNMSVRSSKKFNSQFSETQSVKSTITQKKLNKNGQNTNVLEAYEVSEILPKAKIRKSKNSKNSSQITSKDYNDSSSHGLKQKQSSKSNVKYPKKTAETIYIEQSNTEISEANLTIEKLEGEFFTESQDYEVPNRQFYSNQEDTQVAENLTPIHAPQLLQSAEFETEMPTELALKVNQTNSNTHSRQPSSITQMSCIPQTATGKYPDTTGKSFMLCRSMLSLSVKQHLDQEQESFNPEIDEPTEPMMMVQYTEDSMQDLQQPTDNSQSNLGMTQMVDDVSPIAQIQESAEFYDNTQSVLGVIEEDEKKADTTKRSRNNPRCLTWNTSFVEALANKDKPEVKDALLDIYGHGFTTFQCQFNAQESSTEKNTEEKTEDWKEAEQAIAQHNSQRQTLLQKSNQDDEIRWLRQIESSAASSIQRWFRAVRTKTNNKKAIDTEPEKVKISNEIQSIGNNILETIASEPQLYEALQKSMMQTYMLFHVAAKLKQRKK